jgi:DNA (cytosine-5)-methyltransferase 1
MLKVLDLFSGIGGFSLGLERTGGFETVAFCEIEDYPRRVLAKHWPNVPIYKDVKELTYERLEADGLGGIDIIVGGYPCQPFSTAGQRRGAEDDRHLWPEVKRLVASIRPAWCLFENVAGHISMGLDEVLSDLEGEGYTAWPVVIPACAVDAPHRRDRVWIIAHTEGAGAGEDKRGLRGLSERCSQGTKGLGGYKDVANPGHTGVLQRRKHGDGGENGHIESGVRRNVLSGREQGKVLADACCFGSSGQRGAITPINSASDENWQIDRTVNDGRWPAEPDVGRVAHGIPRRVDRLRGLGNSVVPQIPEMIGYAILESK